MLDYIFGYGSLINSESRAQTGCSGTAISVRVTGFQRAWNVVDQTGGTTYLGVVSCEGSVTNGILASIPATDLPLYDQREGGYTRIRLDPTSIVAHDGQPIPDGAIWMYLPDEFGCPTQDCPIAQSYLDVVLAGCLELGETFAAEFVRTTANWDSPWIDDRSTSGYVRALENALPATFVEIDRILRENGRLLRGGV